MREEGYEYQKILNLLFSQGSGSLIKLKFSHFAELLCIFILSGISFGLPSATFLYMSHVGIYVPQRLFCIFSLLLQHQPHFVQA